MLEKMEQVILLKDFYGPLLTPKQQEVLNLHYEQDWSLSEIAEHWQISRQAVFDLIKGRRMHCRIMKTVCIW